MNTPDFIGIVTSLKVYAKKHGIEDGLSIVIPRSLAGQVYDREIGEKLVKVARVPGRVRLKRPPARWIGQIAGVDIYVPLDKAKK